MEKDEGGGARYRKVKREYNKRCDKKKKKIKKRGVKNKQDEDRRVWQVEK